MNVPERKPLHKPKFLDEVRRALRLRHYSIRTEKCYLDWIRRFMGHKDVSTTMIYTHVLNKPGVAVRSPID